MGRHKLERFRINATRRNVIEPGKEIFDNIKGQWNSFFDNKNPLVLELGCGRGEYTTGLAERFKDKNFIGVDIKGSRIWKGSTVATENMLNNVAFLRIQMQYLPDFFSEREVSEIWLTFPDPRPKDKEEKHRLTNPSFLKIYQNILSEDGMFHLKTDNNGLFEYTLGILSSGEVPVRNLQYTADLYSSPMAAESFGIKTTFERKYLALGTRINYLRCNFIRS